ncbi:hypothetical protein GCM10012275_39810 [Longimycelium tulufanense]|uniref:Aminoglycoside phosphotransferase n=1 Tax=Longimycelium tulufanense TaxID=907463 RepID=A0A8J3CGX7_9PSEU|nr:phosphotransferase [Longimycelium tulufanense]GGM65295.1 hypothetical protein GCM10012275_39810 [Longimycelium tulufanense]
MIEPTSEADARFREWMRDNLTRAAQHFGLKITGKPRFGWLDRSISAPARRDDRTYWLRVVSEDPQWTHLDFWTGNRDANAITGVSKPYVLDVYEWAEWRQQRAEIMTRLSGRRCSPTDVLRTSITLPEHWWTELHRTISVISATPTHRVNADQDKVTQRIRERFGGQVDPAVDRWDTVHGDLHWANLMRPEFGLLDWELWGRGPAGTDAATLLCYSLLIPDVAERVRTLFADVLASPTGRIAQLYVVARLLRRIDGGDFPDLAKPLAQHARSLLGR